MLGRDFEYQNIKQKINIMEKNQESVQTEQNIESGKSTSYFKFIIIFSVVMAALLIGLNYLFSHFF